MAYGCGLTSWPGNGSVYEPAESILITAPAEEPVSLELVKASLRIDDDDEDELFEMWISAARSRLEGYLDRAIISQVREVRLDRFYDALRLPRPIHAADAIVSVSYTDANGTAQTVASSGYRLTEVGSRQGAILLPAYNASWPSARLDVDAVRVRYTAGWADAAAVPREIKVAICQIVGHFNENREAVADAQRYEVPMTAWEMAVGWKSRWF